MRESVMISKSLIFVAIVILFFCRFEHVAAFVMVFYLVFDGVIGFIRCLGSLERFDIVDDDSCERTAVDNKPHKFEDSQERADIERENLNMM